MTPDKLTQAQERAYRKLTTDWQALYQLSESITMLNTLVKKGYAERDTSGPGGSWLPRYRAKEKNK